MCKNTHLSWNFLLHHSKISPISSSLAVLKLTVTVIKSIRTGKQTAEEREYKIVPNVEYNCTQCSVHLYSMFSTFVLNIVYIKYFALFQQIPLVLITFAQCCVDFIKFKDLPFSFPISVFRLSSLCVLLSRETATSPAPALTVKETLRPLRSLREMERIRVLFLHADYAKSAEFFFFFMVHAGAGEVANFVTTRVRRADANGYRLEVSGLFACAHQAKAVKFQVSSFPI